MLINTNKFIIIERKHGRLVQLEQ